jgi:tetratricopeptide (TPR) repeat protein
MAKKDFAVAKRMVQAGEFSLVIPRLQQIITKYPGEPVAIEARYYLAQSYNAVNAYDDALRYANEYLELNPEGPHAESGRELLARLTSTIQEENPAHQQEEIERLLALIEASSDAMAPKLELAEFYWTHSEYEKAGALYRELLQQWPGLAEDAAIRRRMTPDNRGQWVVLSPQEAERRYREEEPLLIYNINAYRSGRLEGWPVTGVERYYNVAGQAVNQSERPLDDVRIIVTIYGFGHMVYDTKTISLGTLRPREVRAFSAQFSNFDNIHNIARHECAATFRR